MGKVWSLMHGNCCLLIYCCRFLINHSFLSFFSNYLGFSLLPPGSLSLISSQSSFFHSRLNYSLIGQISFCLKIILNMSSLIFSLSSDLLVQLLPSLCFMCLASIGLIHSCQQNLDLVFSLIILIVLFSNVSIFQTF